MIVTCVLDDRKISVRWLKDYGKMIERRLEDDCKIIARSS
jgi:hypothetical protein